MLTDQGYPEDNVQVERYLHLRYEGADNAVMVPENNNSYTYLENFVARYKVEFGFALKNRARIVNDYRVHAAVPGPAPVINRLPLPTKVLPPPVLGRPRPTSRTDGRRSTSTTRDLTNPVTSSKAPPSSCRPSAR